MISAFGVNGFTASHLAALQYHGVKRVMIVFDRDEAGDRGADAIASELAGAGIEAWRVRFPARMDANAYAVKSSNPESALALALEQSVRMAATVGSAGPLQSDTTVTAETVTDSNETRPSLAALPNVQTATVAAATAIIACETTPSGDLFLRSGPRVWRVRGWQKNTLTEVMKVNVQVLDESTDAFHVDQLDMYHAKQRQGFVSTAANELACELAVIKREAGRVLLALEQQQDEQRRGAETEEASGAVTVR